MPLSRVRERSNRTDAPCKLSDSNIKDLELGKPKKKSLSMSSRTFQFYSHFRGLLKSILNSFFLLSRSALNRVRLHNKKRII